MAIAEGEGVPGREERMDKDREGEAGGFGEKGGFRGDHL